MYNQNISREVMNHLIVVDSQFVLGKIGLPYCVRVNNKKCKFETFSMHFRAVCEDSIGIPKLSKCQNKLL